MAKKNKGKGKGKGNVSSRLSRLQKSWKKTEPRKVGAPLPPDDYTARIESAVIGESKAGRLQIDWTLTIVGGDFEGKKAHRYTGLETEDNLGFLQGDMEVLGLDIPESIEDLGEPLTEAAGMMVDITVVKNDEYLNIYFNDVVEDGEEAEDEDGEEGDEDGEDSEDDGEEEIVWEKDDRVVVEIDGEDYAGTVTKVGKKTAKVEFDDGDVQDVALEDLTPEEEED